MPRAEGPPEGKTKGITLYSDSRFTSPWVLSVWVALKEKKIPFRVQVLDLDKGEVRTPLWASRTLTSKVPAIQVGDRWLAESLAILEWLEDAYPRKPRLLPAEPWERARDRQILSWLRSDLMEMRRCMPFEGIFQSTASVPSITPQGREETRKLLRVVSDRLAAPMGGPTLADFELAFMLRRPIHYNYELVGHRDAVAYSDSIWNRPSVQSWVSQERS